MVSVGVGRGTSSGCLPRESPVHYGSAGTEAHPPLASRVEAAPCQTSAGVLPRGRQAGLLPHGAAVDDGLAGISCGICRGAFIEPVLLDDGFSYCAACVAEVPATTTGEPSASSAGVPNPVLEHACGVLLKYARECKRLQEWISELTERCRVSEGQLNALKAIDGDTGIELRRKWEEIQRLEADLETLSLCASPSKTRVADQGSSARLRAYRFEEEIERKDHAMKQAIATMKFLCAQLEDDERVLQICRQHAELAASSRGLTEKLACELKVATDQYAEAQREVSEKNTALNRIRAELRDRDQKLERLRASARRRSQDVSEVGNMDRHAEIARLQAELNRASQKSRLMARPMEASQQGFALSEADVAELEEGKQVHDARVTALQSEVGMMRDEVRKNRLELQRISAEDGQTAGHRATIAKGASIEARKLQAELKRSRAREERLTAQVERERAQTLRQRKELHRIQEELRVARAQLEVREGECRELLDQQLSKASRRDFEESDHELSEVVAELGILEGLLEQKEHELKTNTEQNSKLQGTLRRVVGECNRLRPMALSSGMAGIDLSRIAVVDAACFDMSGEPLANDDAALQPFRVASLQHDLRMSLQAQEELEATVREKDKEIRGIKAELGRTQGLIVGASAEDFANITAENHRLRSMILCRESDARKAKTELADRDAGRRGSRRARKTDLADQSTGVGAPQNAEASLQARSTGSVAPASRSKPRSRWVSHGTHAKGKGVSPLHIAASKGHVAAAQLFLNDDVLDRTDGRQWTPLMTAANEGHAAIVRLLLKQRADVHHKDYEGLTAHAVALRSGHIEVASEIEALCEM